MSLASRVANLFSGSSTTPGQDQSKFNLANDGLSDRHINFPDVESRRKGVYSHTMVQKEVKEEGRPTYLHVRPLFPFSVFSLLTLIVHDRWWNWRYYW
jgi:hypothetical protein